MQTFRNLLIVACCLIASSALAQQPAPSTIAIQIGNAVNNMALELERNQQVIATLQKQLTEAQLKIKGLENKPDTDKPAGK